jgi:hypothetical protein
VAPVGGALDASGLLSPGTGTDAGSCSTQPAPLCYVRDSRSNAQAPYEIVGKSTVDGEIIYQGQSRSKTTVQVAAAGPALADVVFAGEAPGYTGLLQINGRVPRWLPQAQLRQWSYAWEQHPARRELRSRYDSRSSRSCNRLLSQ